MSAYALELNDAEFVAWDATSERLRESGYAALGTGTGTGADAARWQFGAAAAATARLRPHESFTAQWAALDATAVGAAAIPAAEVAWRQMLGWRDALGADPGIWLASPAATHAQLGLLLGIAQAAELEVAVLADRAAAAASALPVEGTVFCIDVELERAVLSEVRLHAGRAARHRVAVLPELGLRPLLVALAKGFAARMVRETRFDPLHDAATDQALFDALPGWLEQLARTGLIAEAAIPAHGDRFAIEYRSAHAAADLAEPYRALLTKLHGLRPAQSSAALLLSATAARLPGLNEVLGEFADAALYTANAGQAAQAALGLAASIQPDRRADALQLTLPHHPYEAWLPARTALPPAPETCATHVVFQGRALALASQPLPVGTAPAGPRTLCIPASVPGVSRRHCTLLLEGGQAFVVDHSRHGSFLNEERIASRALLRVGDRLRLGNPGVELGFVRME